MPFLLLKKKNSQYKNIKIFQKFKTLEFHRFIDYFLFPPIKIICFFFLVLNKKKKKNLTVFELFSLENFNYF